MKQSLLNEALAVVNKNREQAESVARKNLEMALQNQEFKNLYTSYTSLMIENAKKEAFGEDFDGKKLVEIKDKLKEKLKELKIPSIKPNYTCKKCDQMILLIVLHP